MKKTLLTLVVAGFTAASAFGQFAVVTDETDIIRYGETGKISDNPVDRLGTLVPFESETIVIRAVGSTVEIVFDSNWVFAQGQWDVGNTTVHTASLFFMVGTKKAEPVVSDFTHVINFNKLDASVYAITDSDEIVSSFDLLDGVTGIEYGGAYINRAPGSTQIHPVPVQYDPGAESALATGTVAAGSSFFSSATGLGVWTLTIESASLADLLRNEDGTTLLWGTATCANDVIVGSFDGTDIGLVPEPSTYGLLGALLLLGMIAHRRLRK